VIAPIAAVWQRSSKLRGVSERRFGAAMILSKAPEHAIAR
jgi:hypothetical protein